MKRFLVGLLCICILFSFSACGSNESGDSQGLSSKSSAAVTARDLDINDFDWTVEKIRIAGYDCYALSLINNSKYDLLGVQIEYALKEGIAEEQLSVFDEFMDDHSDYIDDGLTTADVMLRGDRKQYVAIGESTEYIPLAIGISGFTWSDIPDDNQFDLMEPKELVLGIVNNDNKVYLAYYEFNNQSWVIDANTIQLNEWPDVDIATVIPEPKDHKYRATAYNSINTISVDVYKVSKDDFDAYVDSLKEAGFTDITFDDDDYFYADDVNGNSVIVDLNEKMSTMNISADGDFD